MGKRYLYNIIHKLSDVGQQQRKETYMNFFTCIAIKPLNDGTKGFRFNILGTKGLVRFRKKSNWHKDANKLGFRFTTGDCMKQAHMLRLSVYIETKRNTRSFRKLAHFAG